MNIVQYLLLIPIVFNLSAATDPNDVDCDGLNDSFEQQLLERFVPSLMISENECDGMPAEFKPGVHAPHLLEKNGTVYGQVSPKNLPGKPGAFIEIHYYHLWNKDCGLNGHDLDAEHASVLLSSESYVNSVSAWEDAYWYAAAHEDTACDSSHAIRNSADLEEPDNPTLWISAGKHASFLDRSLCSGGCGRDNCSRMKPVAVSKIINLGEPGAPMNGALWTQWAEWPLAAKMETDFPITVLERLDARDRPVIIPVNNSRPPVKTAILVGGAYAESMLSTNSKTGAALSSAAEAVGTSLDNSKKGMGSFLIQAARGVKRALGGGHDLSPDRINPR